MNEQKEAVTFDCLFLFYKLSGIFSGVVLKFFTHTDIKLWLGRVRRHRVPAVLPLSWTD